MTLWLIIKMFMNPILALFAYAKYETEIQGTVFIHEASRRILFANPYFCKKLGYETSELFLRRYEDICHPEDIAASEEYRLKHGALGRTFYKYRNRYQHKDGHHVVCEWSGTRFGGVYLCDVEIYPITEWSS